MSETTAITTVEEQTLNEVPPQGTLSVWSDRSAFDQTARAAAMLAKTQMIPAAYQGKPEDCFVAIEIAARLNMSPLTVMQQLYIVKGKPTWSGQACMSMIMGCGRFANVRLEYTGAKGTDSRGCYVSAVRVADGEVVNGTEVTMQMAKAEGWTSNTKWKSMPEQMLGYRAAAFFARLYCPEVMMGFQTQEEIADMEAPKKSAKQRLQDALKAEPAPEVEVKADKKSVADALRASMEG